MSDLSNIDKRFCNVDLLGAVSEDNCQGVRSSDTDHGLSQSFDGVVSVFFVVVVDGLDGDFRVGIGIECISLTDELVLKFFIVLDDTVMYANDVEVIGCMRVGVLLGGFPVGCPSCMTNTAGSLQALAEVGLLGEDMKAALGLDYLRMVGSSPYC